MTEEQKADKLLFLAVLAQTCVDSLEDEIGQFRQKHKQVAKAFLSEHLKLMDKDFGSAEAVSQLVDLSTWIREVFEVMLDIGKRPIEEQRAFQSEWEQLLTKYNL
jgi:hypothetical protein